MAMVVRAFPLTSSLSAIHEFAKTLKDRKASTDGFYQRYGVSHESWHLQEIGGAPYVICCTELADPAAVAKEYGAADGDFEVWFKNQVLLHTGVDPNVTPLGPGSHQLFAWNASGTIDLM